MLLEGLVGVMALLAAAFSTRSSTTKSTSISGEWSLPGPAFRALCIAWHCRARDPLHATQVDSISHLDLATVEQWVGGESLRGRTGGLSRWRWAWPSSSPRRGMDRVAARGIMKYWYHFAISSRRSFILTTMDRHAHRPLLATRSARPL